MKENYFLYYAVKSIYSLLNNNNVRPITAELVVIGLALLLLFNKL